MVFRAILAHYNFDIMYICNLIKIPTTIYVNATLKRWGHDFIRNRGGTFKPLSQWEKPNVKGKTHKTANYPFCLLCPVIQKVVELVIAWEWARYGGQFRIGQSTHFEKRVLT